MQDVCGLEAYAERSRTHPDRLGACEEVERLWIPHSASTPHVSGHMSFQGVQLISWPDFQQEKRREHTAALCLETLTERVCLSRQAPWGVTGFYCGIEITYICHDCKETWQMTVQLVGCLVFDIISSQPLMCHQYRSKHKIWPLFHHQQENRGFTWDYRQKFQHVLWM